MTVKSKASTRVLQVCQDKHDSIPPAYTGEVCGCCFSLQAHQPDVEPDRGRVTVLFQKLLNSGANYRVKCSPKRVRRAMNRCRDVSRMSVVFKNSGWGSNSWATMNGKGAKHTKSRDDNAVIWLVLSTPSLPIFCGVNTSTDWKDWICASIEEDRQEDLVFGGKRSEQNCVSAQMCWVPIFLFEILS